MKGEVMGRAIQIIHMFQKGPVTSRMIRDRFGISRNGANRWIMQACRYMPVVETGVDGSGFGRPCNKYELMR
jgi:hypothetical protein